MTNIGIMISTDIEFYCFLFVVRSASRNATIENRMKVNNTTSETFLSIQLLVELLNSFPVLYWPIDKEYFTCYRINWDTSKVS